MNRNLFHLAGFVVEETRNSTSLILFHRKCLSKPAVELRKQLDNPSDDELMAADDYNGSDEEQERHLRSIMAEEGFVDDFEKADIESIGKIADIHQAQSDAHSLSYSRKIFGGVVVNADGMDGMQADDALPEDIPKVTKIITEVEPSEKRRKRLERRRMRTLRKKKRRRKNRKKDDSDYPPWHCEMKTEWLRMPEGYFPQYVQTGKCSKSKCMFGMYKCRAKRYVIRVLRKNPLRCNPIPSLGQNTTYEDAWEVLKYKITICCECSLANFKRKMKKKERNKSKNHGLQAILPER